MTQPPIDPERLAALLDGRLTPQEREKTIAQLSREAPDTVAAYADAAAILGEMRQEPPSVAGARPPGIGRRSRLHWRAKTWAIAAVALLALVGTLVYLQLNQRQPQGADPTLFALSVAGTATDNPSAFSTSRGLGGLTTSTRAVRLGARISDLTMARQAGDTSFATRCLEIAGLLEGVSGATVVASEFRRFAAEPSRPSLEALGRAAGSAADVAGRDDVVAGAWLEAARAAAIRHDAAFFRRSGNEHVLDTLARLVPVPEEQRASLARVPQDESEWTHLRQLLEQTLATLAG